MARKRHTPDEIVAKLRQVDVLVAQARAAHPDRPVEVWAEDEHRLGLKPVRRRVWARLAQDPMRVGGGRSFG